MHSPAIFTIPAFFGKVYQSILTYFIGLAHAHDHNIVQYLVPHCHPICIPFSVLSNWRINEDRSQQSVVVEQTGCERGQACEWERARDGGLHRSTHTVQKQVFCLWWAWPPPVNSSLLVRPALDDPRTRPRLWRGQSTGTTPLRS